MNIKNKRQVVRYRNIIPLKVRQSISDRWHEWPISDISKLGVCFLSKVPYLPGSNMKIKVFGDKDNDKAEVMWCRRYYSEFDSGSYYRVGIKFNKYIRAHAGRL
jgi:hypothetical protein